MTHLIDTRVLPAVGHYRVDPARSSVRFRMRHWFGLAPVRGRFAISTGAVSVADPITDSAVLVEIATSSFHTGNARRDRQISGKKFLDVTTYPSITFRSDTIGDQAPATVLGTLTVRGATQPVTLEVATSRVDGDVVSVTAHAVVDRHAFGVSASRGLVGRDVEVDLTVALCPAATVN